MESGATPAGTDGGVIGVSPPVAPIVNCQTTPVGVDGVGDVEVVAGGIDGDRRSGC